MTESGGGARVACRSYRISQKSAGSVILMYVAESRDRATDTQVRIDAYSEESGELLSSGIRADVIHSSVQQTWTDLSFGADQLEVDLVTFAYGAQLSLRSA
jgi:hypothetical protein